MTEGKGRRGFLFFPAHFVMIDRENKPHSKECRDKTRSPITDKGQRHPNDWQDPTDHGHIGKGLSNDKEIDAHNKEKSLMVVRPARYRIDYITKHEKKDNEDERP